MEVFEDLTELVKLTGFSGTIAIISLVIVFTVVTMITKRMKGLTDAITLLTEKVSSPHIDTAQSLIIFRAVMKDHIQKKLQYLGEVLERNSIHSRRVQIEKNIGREFRRITMEEADKLGSFNSVCGDMGKILLAGVNWELFLPAVFEIFFNSDSEHQKIMDIKTLMNSIVDKIAIVIEENGVHNC
ncbi:MAG: hypothetical protein PQJ58_17225 [Spirochaetales bacterium]|nr:hypothetical protein [Spirochaetales bacterium]